MTKTLRALLIGLLLLGIIAVVGGDHDSSLWPLAGRFHPLLVHLPIGMLLLAVAAELLGRNPERSAWRPLVPLALLLGAWSAILADIVGLLLSDWGSYDPDVLQWHRWLGLGIPVLASATWWLREKAEAGEARAHRSYPIAVGVLLLAITIGGHLGGTLTRGEGYLTRYLPEGVRAVLGLPAEEALTTITIGNPDTTRVYATLIQPILTSRCGSCHNPMRHKGGLVLTTSKGLFAGGRQGKVVVAGRAEESELMVRVSLPPGHTDAMPPDRPLSIAEAELLRWWIAQGASTDIKLSMIERPSGVRRTLAAYGLEDLPTGIFALTVPPADTAAIAAARAAGMSVVPLARKGSYLSVAATSASAAQLARLRPLLQQVASVDLSRAPVNDSVTMLIAAMPHLTRLKLTGTRVSDAGVVRLASLQYLESLNLVDTDVGDAGLRALERLPRLRAVHLWGTRVTAGGVARLQQILPRVVVTLAAPVMPPDSFATDTTKKQ
ncbi:MAG: hypothetical protein IPP98_03440 [Gemmatimonadetes bacterium]|nr:hypothetical protein [Gemmatimonadota bacterium]MBL0178164.1 hypothetical protein [Gemmatimonadota bacterium]MBP6444491.1 hypothetical protein [Gemmatimonadales bacterium]MBP6572055.1 hypothetical protein [Gemmatimonadales bacterium]